MTTIGLYILVLVAFTVPVVAQVDGTLIEEVSLTHTHPIELWLAAEETGTLLGEVWITLYLFCERLVHIEVLT